MHPQIAELTQQLETLTTRATQLAEHAGEELFGARPQPGTWSASECLDHLSITADAYLPLIDGVLASSVDTAVSDTHRYRCDLMAWLLSRMLEPPPRFKVKTPAKFEPLRTRSRHDVMTQFVRAQRSLSERLMRASNRDLRRLRVASPFSSRMHYNVYGAFVVLLAHERRHLWQAERAVTAARAG